MNIYNDQKLNEKINIELTREDRNIPVTGRGGP
jgi:hypothetical protein